MYKLIQNRKKDDREEEIQACEFVYYHVNGKW